MPDDADDIELIAYLKEIGLSGCKDVLVSNGITSLILLKELCEDDEIKAEVVKAIKGGEANAGARLAAKKLEKLTAQEVEAHIASLAKGKQPKPAEEPDAEAPDDEDFTRYLKARDLAYYQPVLRDKGISSLRQLAKLLADAPERAEVRKRIEDGCTIGGKKYKGSKPAAALFDELKDDEVLRDAERDAKRRDETRSKEDADKLSGKKAELEEAMRQVEVLRAECEKEAKAGRDAAAKAAGEELEKVLKRANAKELLDELKFGNGSTIAEINAALDKVQIKLDAKLLASIEKMIDTTKRTPSELAAQHGLMRGFCINAGGCDTVSGGDLLDMDVRALDAPPSTNVTLVCSSESLYGSAVRIVETASSAFSTANKAKGAAFIGSGIGAVSAAGNHARARQQLKDQADAEKTSKATHYRLDYIWEPHGAILLPSTEFRLSRSALRALATLAETGGEERRKRARKFLREFGSHVFSTVILGGWYRHVASATSNSTETLHALDSALSEASNWAVSVAGSYVGLAGAGMLGTANQGDKGSARGRSERQAYQVREQRVEITTSVLGGMGSLPIDHWKASVLHSAHWKPIDRNDPRAIWEILEDCDLPLDLEDKRKMLAKLLETSWINDIFLPSIDTQDDSKLRGLLTGKTFADAEALTRAIQLATAGVSPPMRLAVFRKRFEPAVQHFRDELTLPAGYKILSGGVEATGQTGGNLIVSSHPAIEGGQWKWKAEMKDSRRESRAVHIISVIALHDPDDAWPVEILRRTSGTKQSRQSQTIEPTGGYVITGGGVRVTPFEDTHVLGCGFSPAPAGDPTAPRSWTATTAHYTDIQRFDFPNIFGPAIEQRNLLAPGHEQELLAIVVRPPDGGRLHVDFGDHHIASQTLHDHVVTHGSARDGSAAMIGGGVVAGGARHWLTGSNPAIDNGTLFGWHASSREHPQPGPSTLDICTVAVRNAEWIPAKDLPAI